MIDAVRAASTLLVVGGVALAALLLHPDAGPLAKGRGPLGDNPVLVVGLALLSLLGGLGLREKYREQVRADREPSATEQRVIDGVSRVLLAASLIVPLLVLVLHRFGSSGGGYQGGHESLPLFSPSQIQPGHAGHRIHFGLTRILLGLALALLVSAVVIAGLRLWRYMTRPSALDAPVTYATPGGERERLSQAVDSGRRALLGGTDARAAVILCYASMEESLAASGMARHASDSPQDLLERAVAGGLPARAAVVELTALFHEARYSTHAMDGSHRHRAAAALAEIADGLRARASGSEAVAGAL